MGCGSSTATSKDTIEPAAPLETNKETEKVKLDDSVKTTESVKTDQTHEMKGNTNNEHIPKDDKVQEKNLTTTTTTKTDEKEQKTSDEVTTISIGETKSESLPQKETVSQNVMSEPTKSVPNDNASTEVTEVTSKPSDVVDQPISSTTDGSTNDTTTSDTKADQPKTNVNDGTSILAPPIVAPSVGIGAVTIASHASVVNVPSEASAAFHSALPVVTAIEAIAPYTTTDEGRQNLTSLSNHSSKTTSSTTSQKPRVVFVLGGPGVGKGTQCALIVQDFGFVHLSAGDLLRDEQKKGGEVGEMIKKIIAEGAIVPVSVTLGLIRQAMETNMAEGRYHFLIDGFPRNEDNLKGWHESMAQFAQVEFCLYLDCPESVMETRLMKRAETSGRIDDNAESIQKRFKTYVASTKPVIQQFQEEGKLRQVAAEKTVDEVRQDVKHIFEQVDWKSNPQ